MLDAKRRRAVRLAAAVTGAVTLVMAPNPAARGQSDDHSVATALVQQVERDDAHRIAAAGPLAHAKDALERAMRLRNAGDEAHAKAADGLAREWAEMARDVALAVDAEAKAGELRRKAVDAQAQLDRTRALVEEGITHVGRLRAELESAERTTGTSRTAVEVHDGDAKKPKQATPSDGARP
jgi:hypothetical protein